ncbi:hypothetical protein ACFQE0_27500 [Methylobacterium komagatae]|uniref:DUF7678 domain-containing protein n=1 Tax=Methylobacterium komagatae TaxID=374425 RepID=A0ABW2BTQ5_9HYPH
MGTTETQKDDIERRRLQYYDAAKVEITKGDPVKDFHLQGNVTGHDGYTFRAKVYDVGSEHGIDGGRISKLQIHRDGKEVANYDRGWSTKPGLFDGRTKAALSDVKAAFGKDVPEQIRSQSAQEYQARPVKEEQQEDRPARGSNPMGFFADKKASPAPMSSKDWTTGGPARHTSAPRADRTDDNDHSR